MEKNSNFIVNSDSNGYCEIVFDGTVIDRVGEDIDRDYYETQFVMAFQAKPADVYRVRQLLGR